MIDLRSDTVTKPTNEMRHAMAVAEVGDDVYGEDPTVNRLEQAAAAKLGKDAALFVPTGTMGNTIAIKLHTEHGQEVICDARAHIFNYELSMVAWFAGCVARPIPTSNGILDWHQIHREYRPIGPHAAPTGLIEIENTHNMGGGSVYPQDVLDDICDRAHELGLPVHMDGARLFNAAEFLGLPVSRVVEKVDTVMFCLSKALGAPAGSMLAGPTALIEKGRLLRKRLGGGMRQAGILAAAGLIALEQMPRNLAKDHANAKLLEAKLSEVDGVEVAPVQTNIVIFRVAEAVRLSAELKERGILANAISPTSMRMVTHFDVSQTECLQAAATLSELVGSRAKDLHSHPVVC